MTADNKAAGASDSEMEEKCEVFRQLCRLIGRERGDRRHVGSIRSDFSVERDGVIAQRILPAYFDHCRAQKYVTREAVKMHDTC